MKGVKERPIIFSGPMVRAIIEGRKTQTRRVVQWRSARADAVHDGEGEGNALVELEDGSLWPYYCYDGNEIPLRCPYGVVGDRLWVKEKHVLLDRDGWWDQTLPRDAFDPFGRRNGVAYADNEHDPDSERCRKDLGYRWRPSIHMPRWASRITLEITGVRVERLQEISEADAEAEGIDLQGFRSNTFGIAGREHRINFSTLWDSINAKRHPWSSNPFVWVLEFRRLEAKA